MRTLLTLLVAALAVALSQTVSELPPRWVSLALLLSGGFTAAALLFFPHRRPLPIALLAAAALASGYAWWRADLRLADALPKIWEGRDIVITGVVDELPQADTLGVRFAFAVEQVQTPGASVPARIALGWYRAASGDLLGEPLPRIVAGERWQLTVRLRRPHGYANPEGFDGEAWMLDNALRATGSVRNDEPNRRLAAHAGRAIDYVNQWRDRLRQRMVAALGERRYAGVLVALALGDQRAIAESDWALFNATAVSHLLSISGAHVTLFASWVAWVVLSIWRRSPGLLARLPAQQAAAIAAATVALGYATLAGFAVPAQRTCYMLLTGALILMLRRQASAWLVLLCALDVVLLIDPWSVLAVGFWFSFCAVAILMYVSVGRFGPQPAWRTLLAAQAAVTLGLAPLSLAFFQQVSLVGPLANAVAIPLVTMLVVPLTLVWLLCPIDALLLVAHQLVQWLATGLQWLMSLPHPVWVQHSPPPWTVLLALAGSLQLLAPRGWPHRWLGLAWCVPLFVITPPRPASGEFSLTVLDIGQGTAAVVETAGHTLLYDTGPRWPAGGDAGSRIIAPYLRATGAPQIDVMLVSHLDSDHSGGALSLIDSSSVGMLMSSIEDDDDIVRHASQRGIAHRRCVAGQTWQWDAVRFEILHPHSASYEDATLKRNDRSCVLRVSADRAGAPFSVLLTGDIEALSEQALIERSAAAGRSLHSDVLLVPHHGSRTSSTEALLDSVDPALALINAGYRNRFGHPRDEVLARYGEHGISVLRTDWHGALRVDSRTGTAGVTRWRDQRQRYWVEHPDRDDARGIE